MAAVTYRVVSLGAGVQSSVLALLLDERWPDLVAAGYPDRPDTAVFADTGWEPKYVYEHLHGFLDYELSYPVYIAAAGNLRHNAMRGVNRSGNPFVEIPIYTIDDEGKRGMLRRQCTNQYKLRPIHRQVRMLAGGKPGRPFPADRHVEMYLGISYDERERIKPSRERWITHRYPLVDLRWTRHDCKLWFADNYPGLKLHRSACIVCPYHSDHHWRELKEHEPKSFQEAVDFDTSLRSPDGPYAELPMKGTLYLHSSRRPLLEAVEQSEMLDRMRQPLPFINECEGMCGV